MGIKQRVSLKVGKRLGLLPHVRDILGSGCDYFGQLDHLLPDGEAIKADLAQLYRTDGGRTATREAQFAALEKKITENLRFADMAPGADARISFLREQWTKYRAEVLGHFIEEFPGQRPWAFWAFDFPGQRPVVPDGPRAPLGVNTPLQKVKDLQFLLERGLLSPEEEKAIHQQDADLAKALEGTGALDEER